MDRRQALTLTGLGAVGMFTTACPWDGPSKEKAVKITGLVIDLSKEAVPILRLLGANSIADQVVSKAIPALEKLKEALSKADLPTGESALETVRNVLSGIANALLNLPDSPRRTIVLGILTSINVMLLTVEAFIESEAPVAVAGARRAPRAASARRLPVASAIEKAFQATKF